jgi:6-phosphogluconate dehydrogenase
VEDAIERRIPAPVITAALFTRFESRGQGDFAARVNAALRNQFGGHAVKKAAS